MLLVCLLFQFSVYFKFFTKCMHIITDLFIEDLGIVLGGLQFFMSEHFAD